MPNGSSKRFSATVSTSASPSGKQFYLYVLQTIDRSEAVIGGTAKPFAEETITAPVRRANRCLHLVLRRQRRQLPPPISNQVLSHEIPHSHSAARRHVLRLAPASPRCRSVPCAALRRWSQPNPCAMTEIVRAYHVGRQVDPNHPEHDGTKQHPVYFASRFLRVGIFTPDRRTPPIC
jgi:hypothetical protein